MSDIQRERAVRAASVVPAPEGSPDDIASQLFVEGLLGLVANPEPTRGRVERVMAALAEPSRAHAAMPAQVLRFRLPRWSYAMAAMVLLLAGGLLILIPTERTAIAEVQAVSRTLRASGDRRFQVLVQARGAKPDHLLNTIDLRSPGNMVLVTHRPPWEPLPLIVGRDEQGYWTVLGDGQVDRDEAVRDLPPFIRIGRQTLFENPLDEFLAALPQDYPHLNKTAGVSLEGGPGSLVYIEATRDVALSGPRRVELWINPATEEPERILFTWDDAPDDEVVDVVALRSNSDTEKPATDELDRRGRLDKVLFERVPIGNLPRNWFTPQGHAQFR